MAIAGKIVKVVYERRKERKEERKKERKTERKKERLKNHAELNRHKIR
jgi:hypothetical protein